jgi:hypothetical protein
MGNGVAEAETVGEGVLVRVGDGVAEGEAVGVCVLVGGTGVGVGVEVLACIISKVTDLVVAPVSTATAMSIVTFPGSFGAVKITDNPSVLDSFPFWALQVTLGLRPVTSVEMAISCPTCIFVLVGFMTILTAGVTITVTA